jgi:hypothetical protein
MNDPDHDRESFRTLSGDKARYFGQRVKQHAYVEKFKTIIGEATWAKILCNDALSEALLNNELPLTNYYVNETTGKLGFPLTGHWYIPTLLTIKECLAKNAEILSNNPEAEVAQLYVPDFSFLEEERRQNNRGQKSRNNY